jgi:tRNA threonylcarbamoyladenosine biosynthesis protein TsaB
MALILSIETSTSVCSIALHQNGNLIAYENLSVARSHAESLLVMIEHVLAITHYSQKDLAAVALSEGPGSYTGLRIGAATATGLCYALDIPLIAINTLAAMALSIKPFNIQGVLCCPMIDARRMEVYCLLTDAAGKIKVKI